MKAYKPQEDDTDFDRFQGIPDLPEHVLDNDHLSNKVLAKLTSRQFLTMLIAANLVGKYEDKLSLNDTLEACQNADMYAEDMLNFLNGRF